MKIVKRILLILVVVLVLGVIIGFFMPSKRTVERSATMKATPEAVFNQLNELKNWPNWSPWYKLDPSAKLVYSEPSSGVNAWYSWESNSNQVGKGKLTIVESDMSKEVRTKLEFEGMDEAYGYFRFQPAPEGVTVTWGLDADMGNNPIARLMGPMMDKMLGPVFAEGLTGLEAAAIANPVQPAPEAVAVPDSAAALR